MERMLILVILSLFWPQLEANASLESITLFVWTELEPLTGELAEGSLLSKDEAARRILEETRVLVSAMIYGYEFTYTPSDAKRKVEELFELKPVAQIPWGDSRLVIVQSIVKGKQLRATVKYTLDDYQSARNTAWKSASIEADSGRGEGSIYTGYSDRLAAFRLSILDAVRNHLKQTLFNKPREVRGEVTLKQSPSIVIRAGRYVCTSNIRINIREIRPYLVY